MSYLQMRDRIIAALTGHPFDRSNEPHIAEIARLVETGDIVVRGPFDIIRGPDEELVAKLRQDQSDYGFIAMTLDGRRIDPAILAQLEQNFDALTDKQHRLGSSIHDLYGPGGGILNGLSVRCCECHGVFMIGESFAVKKKGSSIWDIKETNPVTCPYCGHKANTHPERTMITDSRPSYED